MSLDLSWYILKNKRAAPKYRFRNCRVGFSFNSNYLFLVWLHHSSRAVCTSLPLLPFQTLASTWTTCARTDGLSLMFNEDGRQASKGVGKCWGLRAPGQVDAVPPLWLQILAQLVCSVPSSLALCFFSDRAPCGRVCCLKLSIWYLLKSLYHWIRFFGLYPF